jgi:hypothetical protein
VELGVPFLGAVPIHIGIRALGDEGRVAAYFDDALIAPAFEAICRRLVSGLAAARRERPPLPALPTLA